MASDKVWLAYRTYLKPVEPIKSTALFKEHLVYQNALSADNKIKIAFRALNGQGAWHFFINTPEEAEVRKMIEGDPLFRDGYYTYELNEVEKLRGSW